MKRLKSILIVLGILTLGFVIGGYVFADTRPRSFMALNRCDGTCLNSNELVGLMTSIGIQNAPALIPSVIRETDKTLVIEHPSPKGRIHYVLVPKRDIKDVGDISTPDREYLIDVFALAQAIVKEKGLKDYRLITNGPGYQGVTYLHFHLIAS